MKVLVISDLHYELGEHRGVDQSVAWDWLLEIVELHDPDLLLSCGDWGSAVTLEGFNELTSKVEVYTIYGNHENLKVLELARNRNGKPVLLNDCRVVEVGGLRIGGINGIISLSRRSKGGVPRKRPEEFLPAAQCLRYKRVDILLVHEVVPLPEYSQLITPREYLGVVLEAVETVSPRIVFNGHLHAMPYTISRIGRSLYVRVASSQKSRHYAVLYPEKGSVEIWVDSEKKAEVSRSSHLP